MNMRPSKVLRKLKAGETVFCIKLNLGDARVAEIAAMSGFDCLWTDMEHVPNDWSSLEKQILAAKTHDVDVVVRVARGSYSDYIRPLEMDASGIMVPHVMNATDAASIVKNTKFFPLGLRPLDGGNADGGYCNVDFMDYIQQANEQRFNILQIEDVEALDELDAIAALPGVDMIFFGPGDFSQSIGAPGQMDHPKIAEARRLVAEAAVSRGIFAGTVGGLGNVDELIAMGYQFISVGADVVGLGQYFGGLQQELSKRKATSNSSIYGGN